MDQFDLIKGVFEPEEAKEILLYLIDGKIQFHQNRIFSDRIRFGTENQDSLKRIEELKTTKENILKLIADDKLSIHSQINVEKVANSKVA
ncbi:MAG: hypothetical protein RLO81_09830 [Fulvivirga sp.]|uniref:hypothetical protein n=1 Tax=Fulvivirga sp. TaxID=1931237 RepID=UPI0032EE6ABC